MGQTVLGIAILVGFLIIGLELIRKPKAFLHSFDRPSTDKHIRATRLIGAGFVIVVIMALLQLFFSMH
jgi:hypothetical protein